jgi:hypothetical protein
MPKLPAYTLRWIAESASYELWTPRDRELAVRADDESRWRA